MYFQTHYRLDPWSFDPPLDHGDPLRIDIEACRFSLWLEYKHGGEDAEPELLIRTLHERSNVPDDVIAVFDARRNVPAEGSDDWLPQYPETYNDFVHSLHEYMDRTATSVFNTLRWRSGIDGGPLALTSSWRSLRWHDQTRGELLLDQHGFLNRQIPSGIHTLRIPQMQRWGPDCAKAGELLGFGTAQPLYHDLLREAWQSKNANPRSALVMAIAAAETAVKTTAADLSGDLGMEWVLSNLPSPPLVKLLREYIPLLRARLKLDGEVRRPTKACVASIQRGVELRNSLVHGRTEALACQTVKEILVAVRDVLYLLDYYRGQDWALQRLSPPFRKAIQPSSE